MKFRTMLSLLLTLACCTTLTWAEPETASTGDGGCREIAGQLPYTTSTFGHGLVTAPRNAIRPRNLKWELPIAAATGLLIATSDDHINSHIQSLSFAQAASTGSNVGLGIELGAAGLMYLVGCSGHRSSYTANTGFTALEAMGAASLMNYAVKVAPTANMHTIQTATANSGKVANRFLQDTPRPASRLQVLLLTGTPIRFGLSGVPTGSRRESASPG